LRSDDSSAVLLVGWKMLALAFQGMIPHLFAYLLARGDDIFFNRLQAEEVASTRISKVCERQEVMEIVRASCNDCYNCSVDFGLTIHCIAK
jgi:hypothetical protein